MEGYGTGGVRGPHAEEGCEWRLPKSWGFRLEDRGAVWKETRGGGEGCELGHGDMGVEGEAFDGQRFRCLTDSRSSMCCLNSLFNWVRFHHELFNPAPSITQWR